MSLLWQDIVFGARMLMKKPGFTAVAAISLALGIGANTTIFSMVNSTLLSSLSFADSNRLVLVWTVPLDRRDQRNGVTASSYTAWKSQNHSFDHMGAVYDYTRTLNAADDGTPPEQVPGQRFSPGMFDVLGVRPELGRLFTEAEDQLGNAAPVVLLSHGLWQRKYAGDPQIVGKTIKLDGVTRTIIGVMPDGFNLLNEQAEFWEPLAISPTQMQSTASYLLVAARLKPGVSIKQAQAEMDGIAGQLATADPARNKGRGARVESLQDVYVGGLREPLLILQGVVGFVLLIACANVAGLLLARASLRRVEVAIRSAIGAGRWRIVRQLVTESVLLSLIGGLLGIGVGWAGLRLYIALAPPDTRALSQSSVDLRVLGFTVLISVLTGVLFGLFPALQSSKADLGLTLRESGKGSMGSLVRQRLRSVLVTGQIALSLILLIGAGLMINSFLRLQRNDLGGDPRGVLTFQIRFAEDEMMKVVGRYRGVGLWEIFPVTGLTFNRIYERIQHLPGVQSAAGSNIPPFSGAMGMNFLIPGRPAPDPNSNSGPPRPNAGYFAITPNYFATMKIPILRGREFSDRDTSSAPPVVIINQALAQRYWPGEDPLGKHLTLDFVPDEVPREIIGIVGDTRLSQFQRTAPPILYVHHLQQTTHWQGPSWNARAQMTFVLRTTGDPMALVAGVRSAVAETDPTKPVSTIRTVEENLSRQIQGPRLYAILLGIFGGVAAVLSAVGIYGVMAYNVAQRTHEIGVRVALGARAGDVLALVFRQTLVMLGIGLVVGLAGSFALTRLIADQLWGVTATDPLTFAGVSVLLIVVALLACFIPTRRAVKVDPMVAVRYE